MRAPSIKSETQVARELQAKRQQREAEVLPVADACEGVEGAWADLKQSMQAAVHRHDQLREENGIMRRKLRNLRGSFNDLLKAHTLLKHWTDRRKRPKVVCLIGSTRFRAQYEAEMLRLSLDGCIVLTVACFRDVTETRGRPLDQWEKDAVDELHLRKIDLADEVRVINPGGYVGPSTMAEITHAELRRKRISYLEIPQAGFARVLTGEVSHAPRTEDGPPAAAMVVNDPPEPALPRYSDGESDGPEKPVDAEMPNPLFTT